MWSGCGPGCGPTVVQLWSVPPSPRCEEAMLSPTKMVLRPSRCSSSRRRGRAPQRRQDGRRDGACSERCFRQTPRSCCCSCILPAAWRRAPQTERQAAGGSGSQRGSERLERACRYAPAAPAPPARDSSRCGRCCSRCLMLAVRPSAGWRRMPEELDRLVRRTTFEAAMPCSNSWYAAARPSLRCLLPTHQTPLCKFILICRGLC